MSNHDTTVTITLCDRNGRLITSDSYSGSRYTCEQWRETRGSVFARTHPGVYQFVEYKAA